MGVFRCFECGQKNLYELREVEREYEGDGYHFTMTVKLPFCKNCGAYITSEDIENEIMLEANRKIRESRGIVQREEIIEILSKYDVSQKFLSRILGWGEITLTRYVNNNYTPNKINSDRLRSIKDPYVFKQIIDDKMQEDDERVANDTAYKKLLDRVIFCMEEVEKEEGKIYQIINWFLSQASADNRVTHLALQKLLYFAQGWNYAINGRWLFEDECEAWVHGAVYRDIYEEFKKFKYNPLPRVEKNVNVSDEELIVLDAVKTFYFDVYTPKMLEEICHLETPYKTIRKHYNENELSCEIIDKELIKEYYLEIAHKYNVSRENMANIRIYLNDLLAKKE